MIGQSAGRARDNWPRNEARRRFNDEERLANTPLHDDPQVWPDQPEPLYITISLVFMLLVTLFTVWFAVWALLPPNWLRIAWCIVAGNVMGLVTTYALVKRR